MMGLSTFLPRDPLNLVVLALCVVSIFLLAVFAIAFKPKGKEPANTFQAYLKFFYACFVKPHTGDGSGDQQDALVRMGYTSKQRSEAYRVQESFYKAQADVYDATRTRLLKGREDMLGLVAAQLKHRCDAGMISQRPVWVDVSIRALLLKGLELTLTDRWWNWQQVNTLLPTWNHMHTERFQR